MAASFSASRMAPGEPSSRSSRIRHRFTAGESGRITGTIDNGRMSHMAEPLTTQMATNCELLYRLAATIASRRDADPATSYVATLFAKGRDAMVKKLGEEATEAVMAAKDGDKLRLTKAIPDLWLPCLVLLQHAA